MNKVVSNILMFFIIVFCCLIGIAVSYGVAYCFKVKSGVILAIIFGSIVLISRLVLARLIFRK